MPITFFGVSSIPADNGSNSTTALTITPPASMVAGDLVVVYCTQRGNGVWSVGLTGGQTWTSNDIANSTNISLHQFYAIYDGTWTVNPRFNSSAGTNTSAQMLVFRPSAGSAFNILRDGNATNAATAATITVGSITTTQASTVSIASWHTADDNTWGNLSGTGWVKTSLAAQYRNLAGNDASSTYAYKIQTAAGATGTVSQQQLTLGNDLCRWSNTVFYEEVIPTGSTYEESITLDSTHDISSTGSISFQNSITIDSNHDISSTGSLSFQNSITLDSNHDVNGTGSLSFQNSITLDSTHDVGSTGGTVFENSITLDSTHDTISTGSLSFQNSITIDSTHDVTSAGTAVFQNSILVESNHEIESTSTGNLFNESSISSTSQITSDDGSEIFIKIRNILMIKNINKIT